MHITFVGTGYVGLVSGVMMSYLGHDVTCLDIDEAKVRNLNNGFVPIYEPHLEEYIKQGLANGKLHFTSSYPLALVQADVVFIAVGTPSKPCGEADISAIYRSIDTIISLNTEIAIIIKSTIPPGSTELFQEYIKKKKSHNPVSCNPEFLREGCAIDDFLKPDRIIVGLDSKNHKLRGLIADIYAPHSSNDIQIIYTDPNTAELIKYASNSFLATKIAFINEMANVCEVTNANINDLALGIGLDKRIGSSFLKAGPGFGGSCFPKDLLALVDITNKKNVDLAILKAVIASNKKRISLMIQKIEKAMSGCVRGKKIAFLGVTFKANTDDIRSSPAIEIIKILSKNGAILRIYDPFGMPSCIQNGLKLDFYESANDAINGADAIVIATEWSEFINLDWCKIKNLLQSPLIIDLRSILKDNDYVLANFTYHTIGK